MNTMKIIRYGCVSLDPRLYLSRGRASVSLEGVNVLRHTVSATVTSVSLLRLKPDGSATHHAPSNFNIVQLTVLGIVHRCVTYSLNDYCAPDLMQQ